MKQKKKKKKKLNQVCSTYYPCIPWTNNIAHREKWDKYLSTKWTNNIAHHDKWKKYSSAKQSYVTVTQTQSLNNIKTD